MNDFDDELRRILGDDRLAVPSSTDAVGRIVRGARRRRTVRMVASTAASVGVMAALALGSMAVTGQFSADAGYEPEPADSPGMLPPELTPDPVALPAPAASPSETPVGDPTGAATGEPAGDVTGDPDGSADPGGEQPADAPDSVDVSGLPVFDPAVPFDGVQVGMTVAELADVTGIEITRLRGDARAISPVACYGSFQTERAHGYIALRGGWASPPDDPDELYAAYEVATLVPDVAVRTPEGLGVGSTVEDLYSVYPDAYGFDPAVVRVPISLPDGDNLSWQIHVAGGVVSQLVQDGAHNCGDDPQLIQDVPPADFDVPGAEVFGPVRLGMTLAELRAVDGLVLTEWDGYASKPYCYGQFQVGDVSGMVSVRRDVATGEMPAPAASEDDFIVTALGTNAADALTPAGVGVGSTLDQVAAAQSGFTTDDPMSVIPSAPATQGVRWTFETWDADVVQRLGLNAGHSCIG